MKIYILLGHPDNESFNSRIAAAYYKAAKENGHEVRLQRIGDMAFDPVLWKGYKANQELEPDLKQAQENILWCEKWVIVYPVWWGSVPAILKGFFDRALYKGFAFRYHAGDPFWDKLLKGRCAEIISTCDSPWWWIWWQYRNSDINTVKKAILEFCGISPVKVTRIAGLRYLNDAAREEQIKKVVKSLG
jgi:NAD(P)H dehydrogenase (quinone)